MVAVAQLSFIPSAVTNGLNLPKVLSGEERGNQGKVQFLGLLLLSGNATSLRIVIKLSINRLLDVTANLTFQRRQ